MNTVTKSEFEAFVAVNCPMHVVREPRRERDGEYSYDSFDNADGEEIAFITYKTGEEPVYSVSA